MKLQVHTILNEERDAFIQRFTELQVSYVLRNIIYDSIPRVKGDDDRKLFEVNNFNGKTFNTAAKIVQGIYREQLKMDPKDMSQNDFFSNVSAFLKKNAITEADYRFDRAVDKIDSGKIDETSDDVGVKIAKEFEGTGYLTPNLADMVREGLTAFAREQDDIINSIKQDVIEDIDEAKEKNEVVQGAIQEIQEAQKEEQEEVQPESDEPTGDTTEIKDESEESDPDETSDDFDEDQESSGEEPVTADIQPDDDPEVDEQSSEGILNGAGLAKKKAVAGKTAKESLDKTLEKWSKIAGVVKRTNKWADKKGYKKATSKTEMDKNLTFWSRFQLGSSKYGAKMAGGGFWPAVFGASSLTDTMVEGVMVRAVCGKLRSGLDYLRGLGGQWFVLTMYAGYIKPNGTVTYQKVYNARWWFTVASKECLLASEVAEEAIPVSPTKLINMKPMSKDTMMEKFIKISGTIEDDVKSRLLAAKVAVDTDRDPLLKPKFEELEETATEALSMAKYFTERLDELGLTTRGIFRKDDPYALESAKQIATRFILGKNTKFRLHPAPPKNTTEAIQSAFELLHLKSLKRKGNVVSKELIYAHESALFTNIDDFGKEDKKKIESIMQLDGVEMKNVFFSDFVRDTGITFGERNVNTKAPEAKGELIERAVARMENHFGRELRDEEKEIINAIANDQEPYPLSNLYEKFIIGVGRKAIKEGGDFTSESSEVTARVYTTVVKSLEKLNIASKEDMSKLETYLLNTSIV